MFDRLESDAECPAQALKPTMLNDVCCRDRLSAYFWGLLTDGILTVTPPHACRMPIAPAALEKGKTWQARNVLTEQCV